MRSHLCLRFDLMNPSVGFVFGLSSLLTGLDSHFHTVLAGKEAGFSSADVFPVATHGAGVASALIGHWWCSGLPNPGAVPMHPSSKKTRPASLSGGEIS